MKPCSVAPSRGDTAGIVGIEDRRSRRVISGLVERGVLVSDSNRAPVRLDFSVALAPRRITGLFSDGSV